MYSKVLILGRLGNDPTMRYTPQGTAVANFSVASSRKFKNGEEMREETTWYRITAWGRLGEICNEYLKKGREVFIEGALVPDENGGPRIWEGDDGKPRTSFEVRANEVKFIGGKREEPTETSEEL